MGCLADVRRGCWQVRGGPFLPFTTHTCTCSTPPTCTATSHCDPHLCTPFSLYVYPSIAQSGQVESRYLCKAEPASHAAVSSVSLTKTEVNCTSDVTSSERNRPAAGPGRMYFDAACQVDLFFCLRFRLARTTLRELLTVYYDISRPGEAAGFSRFWGLAC